MSFSQHLASRANFRVGRRRRTHFDLPAIVQARTERDDPRLEYINFDRN